MTKTISARDMINEQIADIGVVDQPKAEITYRVVVSTQIYENYGAHSWEGEGECPQYWKAKGGEDYVVAEGLSETATLVMDARDFVSEATLAKISRDGDYFREEVLSIDFVPSNVETYREMMCREMVSDGYMKQDTANRYLAESRRYLTERA